MFRLPVIAAGLVAACSVLTPPAQAQGEVNLYTHREARLIQPLLEAFTKETGIRVRTVFAANGLAERILQEGERSPADLLLTVDIATLTHAIGLGITQPVKSATLEQRIPAALRAPDGGWYAVSMRARAVYASKERVNEPALTYEDLAHPRFKGRFCSRDGLHPYNTSIVAAAIANMGPAKAESWAQGLRANLTRKPSGGDRDIAKDIASGACDIGLANTYYMGLMTNDPNQKAWADAVRVIMPTFANGGGTHVNVSGIVFTRHGKNREAALRLAEFLVGDQAQKLYAAANFEHPVVPGIEPDAYTRSLGALKPDTLPLETIGKNRKSAAQLMEKVQFNLGPGS
jgi:iron(III) transport system substrate-binding protein